MRESDVGMKQRLGGGGGGFKVTFVSPGSSSSSWFDNYLPLRVAVAVAASAVVVVVVVLEG